MSEPGIVGLMGLLGNVVISLCYAVSFVTSDSPITIGGGGSKKIYEY